MFIIDFLGYLCCQTHSGRDRCISSEVQSTCFRPRRATVVVHGYIYVLTSGRCSDWWRHYLNGDCVVVKLVVLHQFFISCVWRSNMACKCWIQVLKSSSTCFPPPTPNKLFTINFYNFKQWIKLYLSCENFSLILSELNTHNTQ